MLVAFTTVMLSNASATKHYLLNKALKKGVYVEVPRLTATEHVPNTIRVARNTALFCCHGQTDFPFVRCLFMLTLYTGQVINFGLECMATQLSSFTEE